MFKFFVDQCKTVEVDRIGERKKRNTTVKVVALFQNKILKNRSPFDDQSQKGSVPRAKQFSLHFEIMHFTVGR